MRICGHEDGIVSLARLFNPERKESCYKKRDSNLILSCGDASHNKLCRKVSGVSFPKPRRDCGSLSCGCNELRWPSVMRNEKSPERFDIGWTAHLPFNGQMDTLRSQMAELCQNAGKHIIPRPANAAEKSELRCFDPNECHCITYSGTENVGWEWECGPWLPGKTKCISDPFAGLNILQPTRPSGSVIHRGIRALKARKAPECIAEPKTHRTRGELPPGQYGLGWNAVDVRPCHTGKDCIVVDYMRSIHVSVDGRMCRQWYNSLDPSSYNITDDQDGLGVLWCPQPHCRNYFKGLPNYRRILGHREFSKKCPHYDCQLVPKPPPNQPPTDTQLVPSRKYH